MGEAQELLDAAKAETGLSDFGEDSFREGFLLLLKSLHEEAHLNALGATMWRHRILGHLKQRLMIEDWYRRHPEIDAVPIRAPLIGLGLPRTGSTALSFLLAEDPNTRSPCQWEVSEPCPPPSTVKGRDPRIDRALAMMPKDGERAHVPVRLNGPVECLDLMSLDFKSQMFQALAQIPCYSDWLIDADLTSTYLYERRVLKLLQWGAPEKSWRLKCPTHTLFLDHLDKAFPDARFVMTHRDPADVILSVAFVYADIIKRFTDHVDYRAVGALNLKQWALAIDRAVAFRDAGRAHRFYDIDFRAMHCDPIGAVRELYNWMGEPVSPEFEAGMARWWTENAETRDASPTIDPVLYGLDPDKIRPIFANYTSRLKSWEQRA